MLISDNPLISTHNVSMNFGPTIAVRNVSLAVAKNTIFGLVGSDGSGKSTLLRMMATMIKPSGGHIQISGLDVVKNKRKVKSFIGYMPQRFGLYQDLTVEENIDFFMDIFGIRGKDRSNRKERYLGFSNLLPFVERLAGDLSGGMKQKLGLACVLIHEPDVLILDEPTNGVDPVSRKEFWDILLEMRKVGKTVLISTAYLDEGEMCDDLAIMHKSEILAHASPSQIRLGFETLEEAMIHRIDKADGELAHDTFKR